MAHRCLLLLLLLLWLLLLLLLFFTTLVFVSLSALYMGKPLMTKSHLYTLAIERVTQHSSRSTLLVFATEGVVDGRPRLKGNGDGWTVSGGLQVVEISLTMPRPRCGDAGMYTCTAMFSFHGVGRGYANDSRNVTVEGK